MPVTRDYYINGETLMLVKGRSDSLVFPTITELGLGVDPIQCTPDINHQDIHVDAWGDAPPEIQVLTGAWTINMNLVHVDENVLEAVWLESLGGAPSFGAVARAGARLGNNVPRFAPNGTLNPATGLATTGNHFVGLNITSPVQNKPFRFLYAYLTAPPLRFALGAERSIFTLQFRAIPYTTDPYGGSAAQPGTVYGQGAQGALIFDRQLDT